MKTISFIKTEDKPSQSDQLLHEETLLDLERLDELLEIGQGSWQFFDSVFSLYIQTNSEILLKILDSSNSHNSRRYLKEVNHLESMSKHLGFKKVYILCQALGSESSFRPGSDKIIESHYTLLEKAIESSIASLKIFRKKHIYSLSAKKIA